MFIENLRNVKKKWRVGALVLIVLLVLGLLSSFAFLGSTYGGAGGTATGGQGIDGYAKMAEAAEKNVKKKSKDAETLLAVITAYDNYATYQVLYLEDGSADSYNKMMKYSNDLLALYGTQETSDADWAAAYNFNIRANMAADNIEGARASFNESLTAMTLSSEYLNGYAKILAAKEEYVALTEDMEAAVAVLEPLVGDAKPTEKDADTATAEGAKTPETLADVLETAKSNIEYAGMMVSMNTTAPANPDGDSEEKTAE